MRDEHVDLSEVHVYLMLPAHSRNFPAVNNGKIKLCCQQTVNAAFGSSSVHERMYVSDTGRRGGFLVVLVSRIKAYIH